MQWSKLKKRIENNFAVNIQSKVAIHSTAYGNCSCGHAWLTLDGKVIANFCTRAFFNRYQYGNKENDQGITREQEKRYENQFVEYGEISRQDVYLACWAFLHELSLEQSLHAEDPLIQTLVVLDKRLGKKRIDTLDESLLHPMARKLLAIRRTLTDPPSTP
ncbi:MAG: hypothetical protein G8345_12765 [Magnetococcales bacterium]|nr:hypothetical protein [Magnetococcales bacterium]NGZ27743.1 hypothetical protein [Magnetococcales bacterium]